MPMFQRPAYPVAPSSAPMAAAPPSGLFGRLDQFRQQNPGVLASFGAALAARSPAAQGFQQAAQMMQVNQQKNATAKYLLDKGLADSPEEAATLASNPTLMQTLFKDNLIQDQFEARKKIAESMGMDMNAPGTQQYLLAGQFKAGGAANGINYGVTPVFGTDAQGNIGMGVTGDDGSFKILDTPGFKPLSPYDKSFQRAQGGAEGTAQGQAGVTLPADILSAQQTVGVIDSLLMPGSGLDEIVGPTDQYRPTWLPSGKSNEAKAKLEQLQGRAFLSAYTLLKGGGQITEVEGAKAENALARLQNYQSDEEFKQALRDFREAVAAGVSKLQQKAGQTIDPSVIPSPPPSGGASKSIGGKVYIQDANGEWYEQ